MKRVLTREASVSCRLTSRLPRDRWRERKMIGGGSGIVLRGLRSMVLPNTTGRR
ncbi:Hypothetical protein A7982_08193 [Minicystis rosea]|nr:Hypothetical protein A7982_08193 [Minicystis rosea]